LTNYIYKYLKQNSNFRFEDTTNDAEKSFRLQSFGRAIKSSMIY